MRLNEIYSRVQLDIDDLSHDKIVKGDYFNFAKTVLGDMAKHSRRWLEFVDVPIAADTDTVTYTHPTDVMYIEHVSMLERNLREISLPSMLNARADRFNRPFTVNETEIDYGFYASTIDGAVVTLYFPYTITATNTIKLTLSVAAPSIAYELRPDIDFEVPTYMQNAMRAGIYYNAIRTLMPREPNKWGSLYPLARQEYDSEMRKLASYVINLNAKNSFPQIQPVRFFP